VTSGPSQDTLSVAFHRDEHAAPLYAACTYPEDFHLRYLLNLQEVNRARPGQAYYLLDSSASRLTIHLQPCESDREVLGALLSGSAQVGILAPEQVMSAVLDSLPLKVIAPLESRGDMLVVGRRVRAKDWKGFVAWVKIQPRAVRIGCLGSRTMTVLGFEQALESENVRHRYGTASPDSTQVVLVVKDNWQEVAKGLKAGSLDAAVVEEPAATLVAGTKSGRILSRLDHLPPGRFEDRPGTVVASMDSAIRSRGEDIGRFLELLGVATHYANSHTRNTLSATARRLGAPAARESAVLANIRFSSLPDNAFKDGLWNWYFALRIKGDVPQRLSQFMNRDDWLGIPYDSSLVVPALDRAGMRIVE
jgi:NitT/TauT family transport system substrate-binding protein